MSHPTGLACPTEGNLAVGSSSQPPEWGFHGLMTPLLHLGAIMVANSSLSQRLILTLTSEVGYLNAASAECACHVLGPRLNPSLCFPSSVLTLVAHTSSRLGILELQCNTLPAHQKKRVPYGGAKKPQMGINLHGPRLYPKFLGCPVHLHSV